MARRVWVIGGVAVGVGALVLSSESRTWLRRRLGLEPEDRRWFEEENEEHAEHEGDEPLDTRESRYSLRARLAEEGHGEPAAPVAPAAEPPPAFPRSSRARGAGRAAGARAAGLPRIRLAGRPRRRRLPSRPPLVRAVRVRAVADAGGRRAQDARRGHQRDRAAAGGERRAGPAEDPPPPPPPTMLRPPAPPLPRPVHGRGCELPLRHRRGARARPRRGARGDARRGRGNERSDEHS